MSTFHPEIVQGTDEWYKIRLGKFTASSFGSLFMKPDTKGYQETINTVVFERLTGEVPESFSGDYMKRGTELEPLARQAYMLQTFNDVEQVGFCEMDEWTGCSPDGLVGEKGLLEIKCPKFSTLIEALLTVDSIPKNYLYQIQGQLFVTGRKWCDYYVWHPKLTPLLIRVPRDEIMIEEIKKQLDAAIKLAKQRMEILERRRS